MRLPEFKYLEPKTLKEAAKVLASDTKGSVLLAGGTDLHIEKDGNEKIQKARIIFSAVGPGPVETLGAEKMLKNASLDDRTIERVSDQAVTEISPMRTSVDSPSY